MYNYTCGMWLTYSYKIAITDSEVDYLVKWSESHIATANILSHIFIMTDF